MRSISRGAHDINLADFTSRAELGSDWDWEDAHNRYSAQQIDDMIHAGL